MKGINGINFSKEAFVDLIIKMFLPILIIVIIVGIAIHIYSKKAQKNGVANYQNKANFHSALISIVITLVLLAVTVCFSVNFINIMKEQNLIEANKIVYYVVLGSPLIPFVFLIYLITRFVKSLSSNQKEEEEETFEDDKKEEKQENNNTEVPSVEINAYNNIDNTPPEEFNNIKEESGIKDTKSDIEVL